MEDFLKWMICILLLAIGMMIGIIAQSHEDNNLVIAEVPLTQVAVKGENDFTAKVKIIYKDGSLNHFELIKGSTQAVPTPTP